MLDSTRLNSVCLSPSANHLSSSWWVLPSRCVLCRHSDLSVICGAYISGLLDFVLELWSASQSRQVIYIGLKYLKSREYLHTWPGRDWSIDFKMCTGEDGGHSRVLLAASSGRQFLCFCSRADQYWGPAFLCSKCSRRCTISNYERSNRSSTSRSAASSRSRPRIEAPTRAVTPQAQISKLRFRHVFMRNVQPTKL